MRYFLHVLFDLWQWDDEDEIAPCVCWLCKIVRWPL